LWDRSVITLTAVAGTNTITATATPALTAGLLNGMLFVLKPAATNTSTVTLNINGGGAVAVVDAEGTALVSGALRINANYLLKYDSTFAKHAIVGYIPATVTTPMAKLIQTQSASSNSSIDFVNGVSSVVFDDTYDSYMVDYSNVKPATDDVELWLRFGTGGGPTYQTTSYRYGVATTGDGGTGGNFGSTSASRIIISGSTAATDAIGNATGENASGRVFIPNPEQTDFHNVTFASTFMRAAGTLMTMSGGGCWTQGTAITAIRFMMESGNITSGRFSLYGLTKI
jgi:hypothetical protein